DRGGERHAKGAGSLSSPCERIGCLIPRVPSWRPRPRASVVRQISLGEMVAQAHITSTSHCRIKSGHGPPSRTRPFGQATQYQASMNVRLELRNEVLQEEVRKLVVVVPVVMNQD